MMLLRARYQVLFVAALAGIVLSIAFSPRSADAVWCQRYSPYCWGTGDYCDVGLSQEWCDPYYGCAPEGYQEANCGMENS